jgi:putative membrane protein
VVAHLHHSRLRQLSIAAVAAAPLPALALHDVAAPSSAAGWNFEPWLTLLLLSSAVLYARGLRALWKKAGAGRGITIAQGLRFMLGWIALAAALLSPLDALAARSFSLHMIQHELLMVVAAPLIVLGRPLEAWAWALPRGIKLALARVGRIGVLQRAWRVVTEPVGAWCFHALALWLWHVPAFFVAALADTTLHVLQHAAFFASALAFWWSVFGRGSRAPNAGAMASLITTTLHTGVLGALLTFAPTPWYALGDGTALGLSALEDQQLGGLVMWAPGGLAYIAAALTIAARWLRGERPPPSRTGDSRAPT